MAALLSPRVMSSLNRSSSNQQSSPIKFAQRLNSGPPTDCTNTQPSLVLKVSAGAEVWERFKVETRLRWIASCSIAVPFIIVRPVLNNEPSTICPLPVFCR